MPAPAPQPRLSRSRAAPCGAAVLACVLAWAPAWSAAAVYKWIDDDGVTHLSSERPPSGIRYERVAVGALGGGKQSTSKPGGDTSGSKGNVRLAAASPEQVARRNAAISELQNRECVVALESMDRLARSGRPNRPRGSVSRRATRASRHATSLPTCSSRAGARRASS
ncbi:MAG: hypothetical protein K0R70_2224 [Steroidobacteraceae bacterium]|nr:hypothetical protein [Steroidobacteraceae bacterium]